MTYAYFYETVIGKIAICENGTAITHLCFDKEAYPAGSQIEETPLLAKAGRQLIEYFEGKRTVFDLPLSPEGTEFQKKVWNVLKTIPYGETFSYKQVAEAAGNPKASRAVGMANNKNPIAIIIPCHRVIGSNGKLVGYAGGLSIKETLLGLEQKYK